MIARAKRITIGSCRSRITILVALLASLAPLACAEEMNLPLLARESRPAVALLAAIDSAGKEIATGTGFFVSADGKLVTNWHVVVGAHVMTAKTEDGRSYKIQGVLSASPKEDIVLLQVEAGKFPALTLGASAKVEVGTRVAVIGSPLGLEGTLSDGIVSAKRKLVGDDAWIQITAPISPGSSGSPVLDAKGEVIGVATLHLRGSQSLNFASPSDAVKRLLEDVTAGKPIKSFAEARTDVSAVFWDDERVKAALAAIQAGNYTDALEQIGVVVKAYPDEFEGWHLQGVIFAGLEFWKDAIASLNKANELNPEIAETWLNLSTCHLKLSDIDAAAISAKTAIKLKPKYVKAWANLGDCYIENKQWKSAESAFRQAIQIDAQNADALYHLGWCLKNQERFDEALNCYTKSVALDPSNPNPWNNIAYIHIVNHRFDDAIVALKKAVELKPDFAEAWNNLATAYGMTGNWSDVKAVADKLRELNSPASAEVQRTWELGSKAAQASNDPQAKEAAKFFAEGEAKLKGNKLDKAILAFRQAVKRQPKNAAYWYWLGMAHGQKKEILDAFNCFSETVKLDPLHPDGWRNLGIAHRDRGNIQEARNAAEQAIRLNPNHAPAWNDLGVLLMNAKNFQRATQCFEAAVRASSDYETAWRNLGIVYCLQGREADARRVVKEMQQRGSGLASEVQAALASRSRTRAMSDAAR